MSTGGYDFAIAAGITPLPVWRAYNTPSPGVPAVFPGGGQVIPAGVIWPMVSIKPNIADVLSGSLDGALAAWAKILPPGARVTCWHEGEKAGFGYSAASIVGMHDRVYQIVKTNALPSVQYGQVYTCFSATNGRVTAWTCPGLDFYAGDGYQTRADQTAASVFGPWAAQVLLAEPYASFDIWESNSTLSDAKRAVWFSSTWIWSRANNAEVCSFFYGQSIPWAGNDGPLAVASLKDIAADTK
jgi:hypothetical protein